MIMFAGRTRALTCFVKHGCLKWLRMLPQGYDKCSTTGAFHPATLDKFGSLRVGSEPTARRTDLRLSHAHITPNLGSCSAKGLCVTVSSHLRGLEPRDKPCISIPR